MSAHPPSIGDWYRLSGGDLFEVVAVDEDDRTVEVQYFDGTLEEIDLDDWHAQYGGGAIAEADAPEDWSGSVDVESDSEAALFRARDGDDAIDKRGLDGLDLFE